MGWRCVFQVVSQLLTRLRLVHFENHAHIRVQTTLKSEIFAGRCSEKDIVREGQQYGPLDARPGYFTHIVTRNFTGDN